MIKCPHCNSRMQIIQSQANDISQVSFYRCTVCVGEQVSSRMLTAYPINPSLETGHQFSGNRSQFAGQRLY